jgi:hypothetical protein
MRIFKAKAKQFDRTFDIFYKSENGQLFIQDQVGEWDKVYKRKNGYSACSATINKFRIICPPVVRDSAPEIKWKEPSDCVDILGGMNKYDRQIFSIDGKQIHVVDVYRVIDAFEINNGALAHALKKLLCAGSRGVKSAEQDYKEAQESVNAAIQLFRDQGNNIFRRVNIKVMIYGKYGSGHVVVDAKCVTAAFKIKDQRIINAVEMNCG